jgi:hypothetical protein
MATKTYELPVAPRNIKRGYWSPSASEPAVRDRWLMTAFRDQQYPTSIFWRGDCLNCGWTTWTYDDGTIDDYFGNYGLIVVVDPETGAEYRACYRCGSSETRCSVLISNARARLVDGNDDVSPIRWPSMEVRKTAVDNGKTKIRTKVSRSG